MKLILSLLAVIGVQQAYAQIGCPTGYTLYYPTPAEPACLFVTSSNSWLIIHDTCLENSNGYLVEPYPELYEVITEILDGYTLSVHAGCYDRNHEGVFYWSSDGTLVDLSEIQWGPGEPSGGEVDNCCCLCPDEFQTMCMCNCLDQYRGICQTTPIFTGA